MGMADDIIDADPDAIEKAMYQVSVGGVSGGLPPYGPALTDEAVGIIEQEYRGISSAPSGWWDEDEWDDWYDEASALATTADKELQTIIDSVDLRLENEGGMGNEPEMLDEVGNKIEGYVNSPEVQNLLANLATPEIPVDSRTTPIDDDSFVDNIKDFLGSVGDTIGNVSVGALNELENFFQPEGTQNFLAPRFGAPHLEAAQLATGAVDTARDVNDYLLGLVGLEGQLGSESFMGGNPLGAVADTIGNVGADALSEVGAIGGFLKDRVTGSSTANWPDIYDPNLMVDEVKEGVSGIQEGIGDYLEQLGGAELSQRGILTNEALTDIDINDFIEGESDPEVVKGLFNDLVTDETLGITLDDIENYLQSAPFYDLADTHGWDESDFQSC